MVQVAVFSPISGQICNNQLGGPVLAGDMVQYKTTNLLATRVDWFRRTGIDAVNA
jgi:hypothetical protein